MSEKTYRQSKETNTKGTPYTHDQWRFILPEAALNELHQAFGDNTETAYRLKRAIELSVEHLIEELADDAECARIIEERVKPGVNTISLEELEERMKRKRI